MNQKLLWKNFSRKAILTFLIFIFGLIVGLMTAKTSESFCKSGEIAHGSEKTPYIQCFTN